MSDPLTVPWSRFISQWPREFKQGQHVTVIGPTGSGKTLVCRELVKCRSHVAALGVKHKDESLDQLVKADKWVRCERWKDRPRNATRVVLWPKENDIERVEAVHKETFTKFLGDVYKVGHWCVWTDELRYMTDIIGLRKRYQLMYIAGRSNKISLVSAAQRPSHVPLEAYSQAQHLLLFRTGDERDLARVGGLNGVNAKQVAQTVAELPMHTFLHVNLTDGNQQISKLSL